jgi:hypothetical protein
MLLRKRVGVREPSINHGASKGESMTNTTLMTNGFITPQKPPLISRAVMLVILCMTLAVWAVVGFLFWIPLLFRVTTVFSAIVVHAAITRQEPSQLRHSLETASSFYPLGFRVAIDTLYNPNAGLSSRRDGYGLSIWRVLIEVFWTLSFWLLLIFVAKPALLPIQPSTLIQWLHHNNLLPGR